MEQLLIECTTRRCNVDVLCTEAGPNTYVFGIRIRPYTKDGKGRMVLGGSATTLQDALEQAVLKARAGRWEPLDWAKRPWETRPSVEEW